MAKGTVGIARLIALAGLAGGLLCSDGDARAEEARPEAGVPFPLFAAESRPDNARRVITASPGVLNLRSGDVDTTQVPSELDAGDGAFDSTRRVVMLDGPMDQDRKAALDGLGVRFGDYLPSNAYIAELSRTSRAALRGLGFVRWVGVFQNEWKIDPEIGQIPMKSPERLALAGAGRVMLNVALFPGQDMTQMRARLGAMAGVTVHRTDFAGGMGRLVIDTTPDSVAALAAMPEVQLVEDAEEWSERSTTTVRWIVQTNATGQTPFYAANITGAGQVASHLDSAVAEAQCAFDDSVPIGPDHRKILADFNPGAAVHGTMTAAIMLGKNLANPTDGSTGIAYDAKLVHAQFPTPDTTAAGELFTTFYTQYGAAIHNNSWGQDQTTAYKVGVREVDRFTFENDDNLVLFAITDTANFLYIPENAKNCLAVSGTSQAPVQWAWGIGGTGPTQDGRLKPELMAPGKNFFGPTIPTAQGNCRIVTQAPSGTSFACPAVSGVAILARQYFMEGYYPTGVKTPEHGFVPSGSLLKAVLINGGDALTDDNRFPSPRSGWGRPLLDRSLYLPGDARSTLIDDVRNGAARSITTGQTRQMIFNVASPQLLRVTLCWSDYPASVNATFAPVNNLDLIVTDPDGISYRGNNFSGSFSVPGGVADAINNLEQVHIAAPKTGVWTVQVTGAAVQMLSQGYALAISGDIAPCRADVNHDGVVDMDDFFKFFTDFDAGSAAADLDDVPGVDLGDFFAFFGGFDVGC